MPLIWALAGYGAIGIVVAAAFVFARAGHALGHHAPITAGGRVMLFPGALALWPLVLWRWARGT